MFLGDRRATVERLVLASTDEEREAALAELLPLQRDDFIEIFTEMQSRAVFEAACDVAEQGVKVEPEVMIPLVGEKRELDDQAAAQLRRDGLDVQPEIMVPLVGAVQELQAIVEEIDAVVAEEAERAGVSLDALVGTMIELPRAALTAGQIAEVAEFFSFGTNDLTQMTFGFSRDDIEGRFMEQYLDYKLLKDNPFDSLDIEGVGQLVRMGVERGRATRPSIKLGICGEHGGDPASVEFCDRIGLDYVSCSPYRVPIARLAAAHASLGHDGPGSTA